MTIDQAGNFLVCSILTGIAFIIIVAIILLINNLCVRYWQPLKWTEVFTPSRFIEPHEQDPAYHKQEPRA